MESKQLNSVQVIILVGQLLSERRFDELGELARQDERVLYQLVETLREGRGLFSFFAATGLSKAGEAAVEPLLEALQDEQYVVRQAAAVALGDIGDRRAVEGLIEGLGDEHEVVRQGAAVSLGKLGVAEAVDPLLRVIGDESELVRKAVVNALGMIGDKRALPALKRAAAGDTEAVAERAREVMQEVKADAAPWWRKLWRKR
jgi:HEAT repeat protein